MVCVRSWAHLHIEELWQQLLKSQVDQHPTKHLSSTSCLTGISLGEMAAQNHITSVLNTRSPLQPKNQGSP